MVDEVLAAALGAQGEDGVRALGLLRDARRILSGAGGLERPGEIVEACVRSAVDALLKLPGAPKNPVGLKSAAKDLLAAVDGFGPPPAGRTGPPGHQAPAGSRAWEPVAQATEVLRGEIQKPGGRRHRQARGIAERTRRTPGSIRLKLNDRANGVLRAPRLAHVAVRPTAGQPCAVNGDQGVVQADPLRHGRAGPVIDPTTTAGESEDVSAPAPHTPPQSVNRLVPEGSSSATQLLPGAGWFG